MNEKVMNEISVGPGTKVTLHFALKLEDGSVVDSTFDRDAASFCIGDGNMLEGFEKKLFGMISGHKETFVVKPEDAFGQPNPNNMQDIAREQFADDVELVEGLMLSFADAQKAELPGIVRAFDEKNVTIDFNHPLAGRNIQFEVEIINVEAEITH